MNACLPQQCLKGTEVYSIYRVKNDSVYGNNKFRCCSRYKLVYKREQTPVNNGGEMCRAPRGSVYVAYSGCSTM